MINNKNKPVNNNNNQPTTTKNKTGSQSMANNSNTSFAGKTRSSSAAGGSHNHNSNDASIMPVKKEQVYRMLDKFFHTLNNPVGHDSFVSAASLLKEISNYISLAEHKQLGEAWRNLYTEESEIGFANLKSTVSVIKSRFA